MCGSLIIIELLISVDKPFTRKITVRQVNKHKIKMLISIKPKGKMIYSIDKDGNMEDYFLCKLDVIR